MRLTLRTLLAYMEDRLSPANAREIGQKIARSPFSTELMERIREVLRKRRLASPDQPLAAIDPNLIAEYLDDQLTPELVARIERQFLSSDAALAEIAAVHQILGSLHEPAAVEPRLRQRLYELDPTGRLEVVRRISGESEVTPVAAPESQGTDWQPLGARSQAARRVPTYVVLVMAFVWVVVVLTDPVLFPSGSDDDADVAVAANDAQTEPGAPAGEPAAAGSQPAGSDADSDSAAGADRETQPPAVADRDAAATPGAPAAEPGAPAGQPRVPAGQQPPAVADTGAAPQSAPPADGQPADDAAAAATGEPAVADTGAKPRPGAAGAEPGGDAAADEDQPVQPPPVVLMNDPFRATLLVNPDDGLWSVARPGGAASLTAEQLRLFDWRDTLADRWFAVPPLFRTTITVESAGWSAELIGPVVARMNTATEHPGLTVITGRVMLRRQPGLADPADFHLSTGPEGQLISLTESESSVGFEVMPVPPMPASTASLPDSVPLGIRVLPIVSDHRVSVYVVDGAMQLTDLSVGEAVDFATRQAVSWLALSSGRSSDVVIQDALQPGMTPDWLYPAEPLPELEAVRREVAARIAAAGTMSIAAVEASQDRNSQEAVAAVGYLAVTRNVGSLLSVLLQSEDESVRRAAIDGLTAACRQTEAGFTEVERQLETHLPMADADLAMALMYGVSDEQARQTAYSAELVDVLNHDRLMLRELASYRLQTIVGDRYGYSADADPGRRRESVRRWQRHLERNNGTLLP